MHSWFKSYLSSRMQYVTIDNEPKWTAHIDKVILKLKRLVGICCKLRYRLPA